ncbi:hypothetical protein L7F22_069448 [Adiantum nelumboides]|nr:hypothetical protein [Adiantum nelumboides]
MGNPALQGEVQQQLHAYGILPPPQQERDLEKSHGETSKRGLSMARQVENPYQEFRQLLEGRPSSKKKGHVPHEGSPSKERERSESQYESMEDVAPRRRRTQRSPTTPKQKRSPHSPHCLESKREEKSSRKKKERKRSPSSPSSSLSSFDERSGYSSKEKQKREHRRSYAAWKRFNKLKKFKDGGKNVSFLTYDGTFGATYKMKEGTPMFNHLNEFNTIYSQLSAQGVRFDEPVRAMFLLITLPESWDTFCTALSNSAPPDGVIIAGVEGSLLREETTRKTINKGKGTTLVVRGRVAFREKDGKKNESQSKSRDAKGKSDIQCYHCGKKGHMKRDCRTWKARKGKEKSEEQGEKTKSSVKIQEVNVTNDVAEGDNKESRDIYFLSSIIDSVLLTATDGHALIDWIIDLGAPLHVARSLNSYTLTMVKSMF